MPTSPVSFSDLLEQSLSGQPFVHEEDGILSLHFSLSTVQSLMSRAEPLKLLLGYVRAMMGFLLFAPQPRQIAMIGLGGGSLAKFCHHHLPAAEIDVIEISPQVIALREQFLVPADSARFRVHCQDGADFIYGLRHDLDVLLVDGFDESGLPGQLASQYFYDSCQQRLHDGGVLAVNLWQGHRHYDLYLNRIRNSFGGRVLVLKADDSNNQIVFAVNGGRFPPPRGALQQRAAQLQQELDLPFVAMAQQLLRRTE